MRTSANRNHIFRTNHIQNDLETIRLVLLWDLLHKSFTSNFNNVLFQSQYGAGIKRTNFKQFFSMRMMPMGLT